MITIFGVERPLLSLRVVDVVVVVEPHSVVFIEGLSSSEKDVGLVDGGHAVGVEGEWEIRTALEDASAGKEDLGGVENPRVFIAHKIPHPASDQPTVAKFGGSKAIPVEEECTS